MKRILTIAAALFMTASVWSQAPEKMSYQAVVRNSSDALVSSSAVGMQISILQGGITGTAMYVETQTPTTNVNGLVSIEIGSGTVVSGEFNTIDWANDTYFIHTETDPTGGTTYSITGTSQLMSVPYALHARTAESVANTSGTNTGDQTISRTGSTVTLTNGGTFTDSTNTYTAGTGIDVSNNIVSAAVPFYLGQDTLGGIVYYTYKDATGTQHGLIVNKNESTAQWQATGTITGADRTEDGAFNTALMTNSTAATYVTNLSAGWYLPSIDELGLLYDSRFTTNMALRAGSFTLLLSTATATYWSSTELDASFAYYFSFTKGNANDTSSSLKNNAYSVRAIRAF